MQLLKFTDFKSDTLDFVQTVCTNKKGEIMTNTDYQNYQLQWMRDHAYSLEHLMMSLEKYRQNTFGLTIPELFEEERIKKHPNGWQYLETEDKEVFCHDSNWFELLVTSESGYCNGYVYESDLSKDTPEDVYRTMFEIARDYFTA